VDGSISLKFGKEFEHVNAQGQWVKGQGHSMKTSSDRQIIVLFQEIGVAEFNGDVRLLIGRWEKFVHMRSTNHDSPPSVIHAFTSDKKTRLASSTNTSHSRLLVKVQVTYKQKRPKIPIPAM